MPVRFASVHRVLRRVPSAVRSTIVHRDRFATLAPLRPLSRPFLI